MVDGGEHQLGLRREVVGERAAGDAGPALYLLGGGARVAELDQRLHGGAHERRTGRRPPLRLGTAQRRTRLANPGLGQLATAARRLPAGTARSSRIAGSRNRSPYLSASSSARATNPATPPSYWSTYWSTPPYSGG